MLLRRHTRGGYGLPETDGKLSNRLGKDLAIVIAGLLGHRGRRAWDPGRLIVLVERRDRPAIAVVGDPPAPAVEAATVTVHAIGLAILIALAAVASGLPGLMIARLTGWLIALSLAVVGLARLMLALLSVALLIIALLMLTRLTVALLMIALLIVALLMLTRLALLLILAMRLAATGLLRQIGGRQALWRVQAIFAFVELAIAIAVEAVLLRKGLAGRQRGHHETMIMLRVLQIVLSPDAITRRMGITRKGQVFLVNVRGRAANLDVRPVRLERPIELVVIGFVTTARATALSVVLWSHERFIGPQTMVLKPLSLPSRPQSKPWPGPTPRA